MPNEIVSLFRAQLPDSEKEYPDAFITLQMGRALKEKGVSLDAFPEFKEEYIGLERAGRPGKIEELVRGGKRGIGQVKATFLSVPALGAEALGFEETAKRLSQKARDIEEEAFRENPPSVPSVTDIEGIEDFPSFAAGVVGQLGPSMVESTTAALLGGGPAAILGKGALKRKVREMAQKGASTDAQKKFLEEGMEEVTKKSIKQSTAAAVADSVFQNTGATYRELTENENIERWDRIITSLIAGSTMGALDSFMPAFVAKKVLGNMPKEAFVDQAGRVMTRLIPKESLRREFLKTVGKGFGIEGTTESLQELIQSVAVSIADPDKPFDLDETLIRMIDGAVAGSLGGSVGGGIAGGATTLRQVRDRRAALKQKEVADKEKILEAEKYLKEIAAAAKAARDAEAKAEEVEAAVQEKEDGEDTQEVLSSMSELEKSVAELDRGETPKQSQTLQDILKANDIPTVFIEDGVVRAIDPEAGKIRSLMRDDAKILTIDSIERAQEYLESEVDPRTLETALYRKALDEGFDAVNITQTLDNPWVAQVYGGDTNSVFLLLTGKVVKSNLEEPGSELGEDEDTGLEVALINKSFADLNKRLDKVKAATDKAKTVTPETKKKVAAAKKRIVEEKLVEVKEPPQQETDLIDRAGQLIDEDGQAEQEIADEVNEELAQEEEVPTFTGEESGPSSPEDVASLQEGSPLNEMGPDFTFIPAEALSIGDRDQLEKELLMGSRRKGLPRQHSRNGVVLRAPNATFVAAGVYPHTKSGHSPLLHNFKFTEEQVAELKRKVGKSPVGLRLWDLLDKEGFSLYGVIKWSQGKPGQAITKLGKFSGKGLGDSGTTPVPRLVFPFNSKNAFDNAVAGKVWNEAPVTNKTEAKLTPLSNFNIPDSSTPLAIIEESGTDDQLSGEVDEDFSGIFNYLRDQGATDENYQEILTEYFRGKPQMLLAALTKLNSGTGKFSDVNFRNPEEAAAAGQEAVDAIYPRIYEGYRAHLEKLERTKRQESSEDLDEEFTNNFEESTLTIGDKFSDTLDAVLVPSSTEVPEPTTLSGTDAEEIHGVINFNTGQVEFPDYIPNTPEAMDWQLARADNPNSDKGEWLVQEMLNKLGPMTSNVVRFMTDILNRLSLYQPETFAAMEFYLTPSVPTEMIPALQKHGYDILDLDKQRGLYFQNRLWINTSHRLNKGSGAMIAITHEIGHLVVDKAIGGDILWAEWEALTPKQRKSVWRSYKGEEISDAELLNKDGIGTWAANEWGVMQFMQIVQGGRQSIHKTFKSLKKKGAPTQMLDYLIQIYLEIRDVFNNYMGQPNMSSDRLDRLLLDYMGYSNETIFKEAFMPVFEATQKKRDSVDNQIEAKKNGEDPRAFLLPGEKEIDPSMVTQRSLNPNDSKRERLNRLLTDIINHVRPEQILARNWSVWNVLKDVADAGRRIATETSVQDFGTMKPENFVKKFTRFLADPFTIEETYFDPKDTKYEKVPLSEIKDKDRRQQVAAYAAMELSQTDAKNHNAILRLSKQVKELQKTIESLEKRKAKVVNKSDDATKLVDEVLLDLKVIIDEFRTDVNLRGIKEETARSYLANLKSLTEEQISREDLDQFMKILDAFMVRAVKDPMSLFNKLQAIYGANVNLDNDSIETIREVFSFSGDATLERLAEQNNLPELLALLTFAKNDQFIRNGFFIRLMDAGSKIGVRESKADLPKTRKGLNARVSKELTKLLNKVGGRAAFINKIQAQIDQVNELMEKQGEILRKKSAELKFRDKWSRYITRQIRELAVNIDGSVRIDIEAGTKLFNPSSDTATEEEIRETWEEGQDIFSWDMDDKKVRQIVRNQSVWLANSENETLDNFLYKTIEEQNKKLKYLETEKKYYDVAALEVKGLRYFMPIAQMAQESGTPMGDDMNKMSHFANSIIQSNRNAFENAGDAAATARRDLIHALGPDFRGMNGQEKFDKIFGNPAKNIREDLGATFDDVIEGLNTSPSSSQYIKGNVPKLLKIWLQKEIDASELIKNTIAKHSKVEDDRVIMVTPYGEFPMQRSHLNIGASTFILESNIGLLKDLVSRMPQWAEYGKLLPNESKQRNKPEVWREAISKLFNHPRVIEDWFVPILRKTKSPILQRSAPYKGSTGLSRIDADGIWDDSGGDVLEFFKQVYDLDRDNENQEGFDVFIQQNLAALSDYYKSMATDVADSNAVREAKLTGKVSHVSMDARKREFYAPEHIAYRSANKGSMKVMLGRIAYHAAFGPDGKLLEDRANDLQDYYEALDKEYTRIFNATEKLPKKEAKAMQLKMAEEYLKDPPEGIQFKGIDKFILLAQMKEANQWIGGKGRVEGIKKYIDTIYGSSVGPGKEMTGIMSVISTLTNMLLQGTSSAMIQFNEFFTPFLITGRSGESLRTIYDKVHLTARDVFLMFWEGVFQNTFEPGSRDFKRYKRVVGINPSAGLSLKEQFKRGAADLGAHNEFAKRPVIRALRFISHFLGSGFKRTPSDKALSGVINPLAPFSMATDSLGRTSWIAYTRFFNRMLKRAVNYVSKTPGLYEDLKSGKTTLMGNKTEHLKAMAKGFGMQENFFFKGSQAVDAFFRMLSIDMGMSIDNLVLDVIDGRRDPDEPYTDQEYALIGSIGVGNISSEGNPFTTRSGVFYGDLKIMTPILTWGLQQPNTVHRGFRKADGSIREEGLIQYSAIAGGLMTMAFFVVPLSVAYSLFFDWWNEFVQGRKTNLRPVFNNKDWGETGAAVVERVNRMGLFGLPFELVNLAVNVGTGGGDNRTLSLDQRVVVANSIRGMIQVAGNFFNQGGFKGATYATIYRPAFQSAGGGGLIQQVQMYSNILGLDNPETRYLQRSNVRNYLHNYSKSLGFEVRKSGGIYSSPNIVTPHVTQMILSAYANDMASFRESWVNAIRAAEKEFPDKDPRQHVKDSFSARHPLKSVLRGWMTKQEYEKVLSVMNGKGAQWTREAISLFNAYGKQAMGIKPFLGSEPKKKKSSSVVLPSAF